MASEFSSRRAERVVSSMVPLQEDVQVWFFASYFLSLQTWRVGRSWVLSTYLSADFSDEEEDMIDNILSRLLRSSRRRSEIYNISWYIYIYIYIYLQACDEFATIHFATKYVFASKHFAKKDFIPSRLTLTALFLTIL
jgi:hypothetical protein